MGLGRRHRVLAFCVVGTFLSAHGALAQKTAPTSEPGTSAAQHEQMQMNRPTDTTWQFMQDGIVFAEFNHQGSPRGGNEFVVPNWWMGMASRTTSRGHLTFTSMFSLDPATVGKDGYREIFQAGEALNGRPLIDRQHPHDVFMQLGAVWRMPVSTSTGFTMASGPVGEPALGPVAFMHRASSADNPTAPLSHHTFDSTHIAFGVVTAAIDHGPIVDGNQGAMDRRKQVVTLGGKLRDRALTLAKPPDQVRILCREEPDRTMRLVVGELCRHWLTVPFFYAGQPQHQCAVGAESLPEFFRQFAFRCHGNLRVSDSGLHCEGATTRKQSAGVLQPRCPRLAIRAGTRRAPRRAP